MAELEFMKKLRARDRERHRMLRDDLLEEELEESPAVAAEIVSLRGRVKTLEARSAAAAASAPPPPPTAPTPKRSVFAEVDEARRGMEALACAAYQGVSGKFERASA